MNNDTENKNRLDYAENLMDMTSSSYLYEAANHQFEKRRSPVGVLLSAACFALVFAAVLFIALIPKRESAETSNVSHTEAPTEAPGEAPNPYCPEEYEQLLAFFELADENGVKNGEKCFKNYDPTRIDFWGDHDEAESSDPCVKWTESGHLDTLCISTGSQENPIKLVGEFKLDGFNDLFCLYSTYSVFDSIKIANCFNLYEFARFEAIGDIELNGGALGCACLVSSTRCRFEGQDPLCHSMLIDLTADGCGKVELRSMPDEHYYPVRIVATPDEGHKFLGWYDADGDLISSENEMEISDEAIFGCEGEFIYTARFE